ncbi:MAG: DNA mismatch repair endonuclease MutL [Lentimicrobiaceae bacterium]|jgi:DNA mismatch repair protein MutL
MSDLIRLLPDSVANQIAAGEVIQRPASAVKELLENAVDAGATQIKLLVKDSGKTLIQVIDNGSGMSETDARMCFERHATSKIREANDLFSIRTLGFRGEALASIAAIAQVELKSRRVDEEVGTSIIIEGSKVKSQEPVACPQGTTFIVRNLFYNVPARRYFLKSDNVEFRHILEEFQRVALVHPDIEFSLFNNDKPVFQLTKGNLRQRIVHIFGSQINGKLLPVEAKTELVSVIGYIGKPETARKTRGEQYFFANGRFIRHPYLHNAVEKAFEELIPESAYPSYFLYIEVEPSTIDINIHPTKTEVNFQNGQLLYASIRASVKHALGMFSLSPTIDFDTEPTFDFVAPKGYEPKEPTITLNPDYNPFRKPQNFLKANAGMTPNRTGWEKMYEGIANRPDEQPGREENSNIQLIPGEQHSIESALIPESNLYASNKLFQVQNRFIVANVKSGLLIVDQQKAYERIIFERISSNAEGQAVTRQRILFPQTIQLSAVDTGVITEIIPDLDGLGFEISAMGGGTFVINTVPSNMPSNEIIDFIDGLLEDYKKERADSADDQRIKLARIVAGNMAVKTEKILKVEEMQQLIDELFACQVPEVAPDGSKILRIIPVHEIDKLIGK